MFSNIHEAWSKDPVKEMTSRLNRGDFKNDNEFVNAFKFKDHNNDFNGQSIKPTNDRSSREIPTTSLKEKDNQHSSRSIDLSSITSPNNTLSLSTYSDASSYAPVDFKRNKKMKYDFMNSESESFTDSKCSYSIKHLKKCGKCYRSLIKLIEKKIKKKMDDVIIDMKFKQLQTQHLSSQPMTSQQLQSAPTVSTPIMSESWKETLIIVMGAIITLFLIFLIVKSLWK